MPVNGRTCYFAGGPSQVEVLRSKVVGEERMAQQLPIGLSPVQRMILENIDREGVPVHKLNWHEGLVAPEPPFTVRSRCFAGEVFWGRPH